MHLLFENVIKNLVLLWTGKYKELDEGSGEYEFPKGVWEAIGAATAASGSDIPGIFAARPPDVLADKIAFTADTWSFWLLYIGPVVLHNRFRRPIYYNHFMKLSRLVHLCLQFEYTQKDIQDIRLGFSSWVEEYEKLYYQNLPSHLSACPLTIHGLLHIADSIEQIAPVWASWAFPTERFCGQLQPAIKSRRYPFANIDNYISANAQPSHIKILYGLEDDLNLKRKTTLGTHFAHPDYPTCILLPPRRPASTVTQFWTDKICVALATRYNTSIQTIRKYLSTDNIERWGKVRRLNGGDSMNASSLVPIAEDRRDATFIRYELLVDRNARSRKKRSEFTLQAFYGQLQHIFVVTLKSTLVLGIDIDTTLILAGIQRAEMKNFYSTGLFSSTKMGLSEVVDMTSVQCLIGRIKAGTHGWVVLDRTGVQQWAMHVTDT
ncbi:hypothetical protein C8R41DRAFT_760931 [Lentinula lateritia]|uniref:Uncharacterized protein n=1 Tax=Lentinula lateritia TaxID=40482 RepID=A0ABQ8VLV9_9AGAR|nr:hypothetical protein C8R41DRAFT_760931 [Lentinula lateritia]